MRLGPKSCVIAVLLVTAVLVGGASGQTASSGALSGVVIDGTHAVVPDAAVKITNLAKSTTDSTKTNGEGVYQFPFLRPARYVLSVTHSGFQEERRSVTVEVGPSVTVNITLQVAKASSEINVTAEAPIIRAESADVSVTMNQKQVSEIPNPGNDLTYIAQTAPGAVMNSDYGFGSKFSILGMPGFSYGFTVDGIDITDNYLNIVRGGPLGLTLGANQTEEATVVTATYSGQFGGAAGGNINYVTKSGSNAFHGNAQYYWNGRVLNANDWFIKADGQPRPFSNANQWAGSLGGPIRKDKLFFFFDTEGLRLVIPQLFFTVIPTPEFEAVTIANIDSEVDSSGHLRFGPASATDQFYRMIFNLYDNTPGAAFAKPGGFNIQIDPSGCTGFLINNGLGTTGHPCARNVINTRSRPSQDTLTSGRVDWNIGQNDRAFFRVQEEGGVAANGDDPISPVFDSEFDNWRWQGQVLETHTFNPRTAGQFLFGASDHYWAYNSSDPAQALAAFPSFLNFNWAGTFTSLGGSNATPACSLGTRALQVSGDLITNRGNHKLGIGIKVDHEHALEDCTPNSGGALFPLTLQAFYEGGFDPASPTVDSTGLVQGFTKQPQHSASYGGIQAYVQDEWRARKSLVLTFALRAEHRANFSCENLCFARLVAPFEQISHDPNEPYNQVLLTNQKHALSNLDRVDWSPRFGFAWQPFGVSHNGVLRGGVGILYDPFQEALSQVFWLNPPKYNSFTVFNDNLAPNELTNLFQDAKDSNSAFVSGYDAAQTLAQMKEAIPNFAPPTLTSAERNMRRPQYQKWSLQWEEGLGVRTSASVGYFGNHGIHELVGDPSVNAYGFGSLPAGQCGHPPVLPCSDPRFGGVTQWSTRAISNYNSMVGSFRHQFSRWGSGLVQVNYTYGHALDEISNGGVWTFTQGDLPFPQDPSNLRGAYGPAEYDVRHSMNADYVWELPLKSVLRGHGANALVNGWQISGTFFARTGFPYTVFDGAKTGSLQQNNYLGAIYAVPVGPLPKGSACGEKAAFELNLQPCLPAALFVQSGCETGFNSGHLPSLTDPTDPCGGRLVSFAQGRNRFRGPSYFNTDLAIMKNTKIPGWEAGTLALGFQFFNVLNHYNFGIPDDSMSNPTFGLIFYGEQSPTGILGSGFNTSMGARMIQLKAELRF